MLYIHTFLYIIYKFKWSKNIYIVTINKGTMYYVLSIYYT